tara:strand:+ start:2518 stop:2742 length:225 start_codon:yes stop_codon:yes gene_type:complete
MEFWRHIFSDGYIPRWPPMGIRITVCYDDMTEDVYLPIASKDGYGCVTLLWIKQPPRRKEVSNLAKKKKKKPMC